MKSLGSRLKEMREEMNYTQVEVSKMLDISNGTLSGYERNYREPDIKTLIKLAKLYCVTTDYLLTGDKMLPVKISTLSTADNQDKVVEVEITHYEREFLTRSLNLLREIMAKAVKEKS